MVTLEFDCDCNIAIFDVKYPKSVFAAVALDNKFEFIVVTESVIRLAVRILE